MRWVGRAGGMWLLVAVWTAGCATEPEPTPAPSPAQRESPAEAPPELPPIAAAPVKGPPLAAIAQRVAAHAKKAAAGERKVLSRLLGVDKAPETVLKGLYKARKLLHYGRDGRLSQGGHDVLALLADLSRHGVDRRPYNLAKLDAATAAVVAAFAAEKAAIVKLGPDLDGARVASKVADWARGGAAGEAVLAAAGGDKLSGAARKALSDGLDRVLAATDATRAAIWAADVAISRAAVRYVVDFTLARPAHPFDYTSPNTVRKLAESEAEALSARFAGKTDKIAAVLRAAWPQHPQYKKLLRAVDRYQKLVDDGGWDELPALPRKKLEKGAKGPWIVALRKRLAAEGYKVELEGERYDSALVDEVVRFQDRHQLADDGSIGRGTLRELNVSAEQRVRQLKLALTRWRSALARDAEGYFVHVNIAAQRVKIWDKGKVLREHRVIVGKDNDDIDYDKRIKGKINRTKMFKAKMKRITLAPRWYPTPRVVDLELGPALAKNPGYFEKHGYVSEMQADGTERVYQRSGPSNLLGVVKFQFPNKHAIYMHDTPGKGIFRRARRAYSHGCIRLHHPKKLAYLLLKRDRGWKKKKIDKIIEEREEKIVGLRTHIWVYIDYISASVEKNDVVYFWSDIYAYDQAYFTGQLPVEETEEYKAASLRGL